jgi:calcium/calmodulin-dependent protein kinase I
METDPPFSEAATSEIVRQVIEGICFMHENGYAHRDLKPNVGFTDRYFQAIP